METLSAGELARVPGVTVTRTAYRRITATCAGPLEPLLALRTVDDVFLQVATWTEIGRPRAALEQLRALSARLDLFPALKQCAAVRVMPCAPTPRFSLSVSFVGKRNYTTEEIKAILAEQIVRRHRWAYEPDDRLADVHVRLFLDHEQGLVGVRLARQPLHERWYRRVHVSGALKPSLAAAMVLLAETREGAGARATNWSESAGTRFPQAPAAAGARVLDPCCGSGTIVIEAALQGALAFGGDSNLAVVQAAQVNCQAAGIAASIQQWQAQALPLAAASVDRVISNLPWGRQVRVDAPLACFYREALAEMRRVLAPGGCIALLTSAPQLIDTHGLICAARFEISLSGQRPTLLVLRANE